MSCSLVLQRLPKKSNQIQQNIKVTDCFKVPAASGQHTVSHILRHSRLFKSLVWCTPSVEFVYILRNKVL